jgi:hypothetical protein
MEFATLSAKHDEHVKGGGQGTEIANVHAIKVEESQEGM